MFLYPYIVQYYKKISYQIGKENLKDPFVLGLNCNKNQKKNYIRVK